MKWYKGVLAGGLALGAVAIAIAGLRDRPPPAVEVQIGKAKKSRITRTVAGAGKVQAATTVKISSNISGDLTELLVKEGDRVTRGQVLGRIDRRRYEAAAKQARAAQKAAAADVQLAQVDSQRIANELARVEALVKKGMASSAELDRIVAERDGSNARVASARERYTQAGALVEEAQSNLEKTTLLAPIDGTVIELAREVGERVRGSDFTEDVVMVVAALAAMEVLIEVSEHDVVYLEPGLKAEITVDALEGQNFEGAVSEVAQRGLVKNAGTEAEVTTFPVTVALNVRPAGVLPSMSAEVRIAAETHDDAVVVPIQAVTVRAAKSFEKKGDGGEPEAGAADGGAADGNEPEDAGAGSGGGRGRGKGGGLVKVVFAVGSDDVARARKVKTGIASNTEIEILDGIAADERVVEGPYRTLSKDLKDGDRVREAKPAGRPGGGRGRRE
ncbi:MAG: efflux RND transporter periplasmic adaptor subunit [Deltaproteobacteria bacterium]|nr:efflux RND transporter periplasmic adaptor subunit [Deltaproteobacteria bacterium]